jgi:N utilization substance protein A
VTAIVRGFDGEDIVVELDGEEGRLPAAERVPGEEYRAGDRIVAWSLGGAPTIVSRADKRLVEALLERHVPELQDGSLQIAASAREPGLRSTVAVSARSGDAAAACAALAPHAVAAAAEALHGEPIQILPFDPDPLALVRSALEGRGVATSKDEVSRTITLEVVDEDLRAAIGTKGHRIRLAAKLSGWRVDIHAASKVSEVRARLIAQGFRTPLDVACASVDAIARGIDVDDETARSLSAAAARAALAERRNRDPE